MPAARSIHRPLPDLPKSNLAVPRNGVRMPGVHRECRSRLKRVATGHGRRRRFDLSGKDRRTAERPLQLEQIADRFDLMCKNALEDRRLENTDPKLGAK